jgi:hypothetical protein
MRREQESWRKEECIQGEGQIAKETSKIRAGCIGCTTAVAIFSLCIGCIPSDLAVHCIAGVASVLRGERFVV